MRCGDRSLALALNAIVRACGSATCT